MISDKFLSSIIYHLSFIIKMILDKKKGKNINKLLNNKRGVTLLELMVAVSLFTITILIATSIFRLVLDGQRQAIASQSMQENLRYFYEKIDKEIRMAQKNINCTGADVGKVYTVGNKDAFGVGDSLIFRNYHGDCIVYSLDNNGVLKISDTPAGGGTPYVAAMTPSNLRISSLKFSVVQNDKTNPAKQVQARVTLKMHAEIDVKNGSTQKMDIQTTIASRFYD